ncbi:MAG: hypothetical protein UIM53_10195 [Acutalibacteraceae bacterium]|nr:hypothetical protein [Acutalibacteraceae bacterium]
MDTAIKNGDFNVDETGKIYAISGMEETLQRCRILLETRQGEFCYNQKLGSNIHLLKADDKNLQGNALLLVKEALMPVTQVKVCSVHTTVEDDSSILLEITISAYNETAKLEVKV